MALKQYEGMFLLHSGKYASDSEKVVGEVLGLLERMDAEVIAHRPWADGKLAYPIEGQTKGVHYLAYFKADSSTLKDLDRQCHLSDTILRYMVIVPPTQLFDLMAQSLVDPAAAAATEETTEEAPKEEAEKKEEVKA